MDTNKSRQDTPDPNLKRSVRRARLEAGRKAGMSKHATPIVLSASIAATLVGWGIFSHQDAEVATTAQLSSETPIVATATVEQAAESVPTQGIIVSLASSVNQGTSAATATPETQIAQATATATATATTAATATTPATATAVAKATTAPIAVTRSSK